MKSRLLLLAIFLAILPPTFAQLSAYSSMRRPATLAELMFPAHMGRADLIPVAHQSGLYAGYGILSVPGHAIGHPRVQGPVRMLGGGLEVLGGGYYTAQTGGLGGVLGGGLLIANGIDNVQAGWRMFSTGQYQPAFLESLMTDAMGPQWGGYAYGASQLGLPFAAPLAASRIPNIPRFQPGIPTSMKSLFTFRGDTRLPSEIFGAGFQARGKSLDLLSHAIDNTNPLSAYISTSQSYDVASSFGQIYVVRPRGGIDVNQALRLNSPFPDELEMAVPWRIAPHDIRGVTFPDHGMSLLNPHWQP